MLRSIGESEDRQQIKRLLRKRGTATQLQRKDCLSTLLKDKDGYDGPLPPPSQPRGFATTPLVRAARYATLRTRGRNMVSGTDGHCPFG